MAYYALEGFKDLQDDMFEYKKGDKFPRDGFTVSEERLAELASDKNVRGHAVIKKRTNRRKKKNVSGAVQGTK